MSELTADLTRKIRVVIAMYRDDVIAGGSLRVGQTLANNLDPSSVEAHLLFAYGGSGPVARSARVPCHRVVRADGSIGQYAGGSAKKKSLLQHEGVVVYGQTVDRRNVLGKPR